MICRQHLITLPKSGCRFGYYNLSASNLVVLPCSSSSRASDANCARVSSDSANSVSHFLSDSISSNTHLARVILFHVRQLGCLGKGFFQHAGHISPCLSCCAEKERNQLNNPRKALNQPVSINTITSSLLHDVGIISLSGLARPHP